MREMEGDEGGRIPLLRVVVVVLGVALVAMVVVVGVQWWWWLRCSGGVWCIARAMPVLTRARLAAPVLSFEFRDMLCRSPLKSPVSRSKHKSWHITHPCLPPSVLHMRCCTIYAPASPTSIITHAPHIAAPPSPVSALTNHAPTPPHPVPGSIPTSPPIPLISHSPLFPPRAAATAPQNSRAVVRTPTPPLLFIPASKGLPWF